MAEPDFSDFIVLLARQRSGTHAVRSILESHADICGVEEIFHLKSTEVPNVDCENTNFFSFLKRQAKADPFKLIPTDYEPLFLEYLRHLRNVSTKRFVLLDVKFNSLHHVLRAFQPLLGVPYLFELIFKHGLRTFLLTRKNYLRYYVSLVKASNSKVFHVNALDSRPSDTRVRLNIYELKFELKRCVAEDAFVGDCFTEYAEGYRALNYADKFLTYEYADIFKDPNGPAPEFLERFSQWLGIPNHFPSTPAFHRQSLLPLKETIENYDEVAECLRQTPYAYCLEDEPPFSTKPAAETSAGIHSARAFLQKLVRG